MKFEHKVEVPFSPTFRSLAIASMFDVKPDGAISKSWTVDIPIEDEPWQIGLIVGPSGSGKTTLAKRIFGDENYHQGFAWEGKSVLDDFPHEVNTKEISKALSSVGFSSPPDWLKPFRVLSNGQQFRAEIARLIIDPRRELVVVDEFTSVVDRQVAKSSSAAVERYIRRSNKQFVAVSCHYDIAEWLMPDWIYQVDTNQFTRTRGLLQRPEINITIRRVHHSAWRLFKGHHYLSADIQRSAHCYVGFWGEEPIAFVAVIKFPHNLVKNMWRSHRTVVLPDYQGLRVGVVMNDAIAQAYVDQGYRFTGLSTHPAMNAHRRNSPRWMMTRAADKVAKPAKTSTITGQSLERLTEAFEYIGNMRDEETKAE